MKNFVLGLTFAVCSLVAQASASCGYMENFDGVYIGGNIGVLSHTSYRNDSNGFLTNDGSWTLNDTNFMGGVRMGYDQQWSNRMVGILADWNISGAHAGLKEGETTNPDNRIKSNLEWYYTLRTRAGIIVSDALVYVTGGVCAGRFFSEYKDPTDTFRSHKTRWGWVGGVGTEFNVCREVSVGGEILGLHFADRLLKFRSAAGNQYSFKNGDTTWVGCFTVNYRFDNFCPCW